MKKTKKLISIFMAILMTTSMFAIVANADTTDEAIPYWMSTEYTLKDIVDRVSMSVTCKNNDCNVSSQSRYYCPHCVTESKRAALVVTRNDNYDYFAYCFTCKQAFYLGNYYDEEVTEIVTDSILRYVIPYIYKTQTSNEIDETELNDLIEMYSYNGDIITDYTDCIDVYYKGYFPIEDEEWCIIFNFYIDLSTSISVYNGKFYFDEASSFSLTNIEPEEDICAEGSFITDEPYGGIIEVKVFNHKLTKTSENISPCESVITYKCDTCGEEITETSGEGHDWKYKCTRYGKDLLECTKCGKADYYVEHEWTEIDRIEATCTSKGIIYYQCPICNGSKFELYGSVKGHIWEETKTVAASCTEGGYTLYTCTGCGAEQKTVTSDPIDHDWVFVKEISATCTEDGILVYECSSCGEIRNEASDEKATGHNYVEQDRTDATCTEFGKVTYRCSRCGDRKIEILEPAGHNYTTTITASTCTEHGHNITICADCGDVLSDEELELIPHSYIHITEKHDTYTCEYDICDGCREVINYKIIEEHTEEETAKEENTEESTTEETTTESKSDDTGKHKFSFIEWIIKLINAIIKLFK